jgi:predicted amidohydrolase YtcJ
VPSEQDASTKALVLNHVTVIDATGSSAKPDMTVVITGNRITAIGKEGIVSISSDAKVIDATGKFLIPGLWDMHAHPFLTRQEFFPQFVLNLYVANGVTGLRDMFGPLEEERQWQKGIEVGTIPGPEWFWLAHLLMARHLLSVVQLS